MAKAASLTQQVKAAAEFAPPGSLSAKALRQFKVAKAATVKAETSDFFNNGHNVVIDRRDPTELVARIGLDPEAMAAILHTTKKDGTPGGKFLAITEGLYNSVPVKIGEQTFFLAVSLRLYEPKSAAKK